MNAERQRRRIDDYVAAGNLEAARVACASLAQSEPTSVDASLLLSHIETRRGRYRAARAAAIDAARRAAARGPMARLGHLTQSLLAFDEWAVVRRLIRESDWTSAPIARQAPVLAQHLSLAGDDEGALRFCNAIRTRIAPDARLEYIAGLAARNLGDADAATAAFERSIAIDPLFAPAHWSLAYHRPGGSDRIARLMRAMQGTDPHSDEAVELGYALYREHEAAGLPDHAWRWLMRAASAKSSRAARMETVDGGALARVATSLTPEELTNGRTPLLFVVGLPRTGTTVLERILGAHPQACAAGELKSFHAALCAGNDSFLPLPESSRSVPPIGDVATVRDAYRAAVAGFAEGGRVVVDKNPANFLYAAHIAAALPEAKILCLRRAPLDAGFSNLKELFPGDAYPYSYSLDTLAEHVAWFEKSRIALEATLATRFMTVDYEAMVTDPRTTAQQVFDFCDLGYHEGAERIERNAAPVSTASSTQVREPVHARGIGAWKRYARQLEPLRIELAARGLEE